MHSYAWSFEDKPHLILGAHLSVLACGSDLYYLTRHLISILQVIILRGNAGIPTQQLHIIQVMTVVFRRLGNVQYDLVKSKKERLLVFCSRLRHLVRWTHDGVNNESWRFQLIRNTLIKLRQRWFIQPIWINTSKPFKSFPIHITYKVVQVLLFEWTPSSRMSFSIQPRTQNLLLCTFTCPKCH